jgi:hypothetical protein
MSDHCRPPATTDNVPWLPRRHFLREAAGGIGSLALAYLWHRDQTASAAETPGFTPPTPRATRVLQVFLTGGISQVDSFDYKPELIRHHGEPMPGADSIDTFNSRIGTLMKSPWAFRQHGQCGRHVSDLLPRLAECVDDLTFIHSMVAKSANHGPAQLQMNTGFIRNGFPSMGSWISYGLGSLADDLPVFVVLPDPRGMPAGGTANWSSAFLPPRHQGVALRGQGDPIANLHGPSDISPDADREARDLLGAINREHLGTRPGSDLLSARIGAYELAARMQTSVPSVLDLSGESPATFRLYGVEDPVCGAFARNCLLARRLLERGVRFVQIYQGGSAMKPRVNWDAHEDVVQNHTQEAAIMDRPVAALLRDLKTRGLLTDTLVIWTSEFGRTPFTEAKGAARGRDHNQLGFTSFLAGAGVKPGISYGATDEFGHKAVESPVTLYDFHATILHVLGLDHERLTFYHNGLQRRLTDVHGRVIHEILA